MSDSHGGSQSGSTDALAPKTGTLSGQPESKPHLEFKIPASQPAKVARPVAAKTTNAASNVPAIHDAHKERSVDIMEHLMTIEDIQKKYDTKVDFVSPGHSLGLTVEEAAKRLAENGPNSLTPPPKRHPILQYLDRLRGLFNLIMLLAGTLTYIIYGIDPANNGPNVYIGAILIAVAFINAFIEWYQERKSQAILESFL
ncbi:hypothetical protein HDU93_002946, partial [Gonapodya sp. JEL0774]